MCVNNLTTFVENSQKILKVINDFSKFTEYEANIQKSLYFSMVALKNYTFQNSIIYSGTKHEILRYFSCT